MDGHLQTCNYLCKTRVLDLFVTFLKFHFMNIISSSDQNYEVNYNKREQYIKFEATGYRIVKLLRDTMNDKSKIFLFLNITNLKKLCNDREGLGGRVV